MKPMLFAFLFLLMALPSFAADAPKEAEPKIDPAARAVADELAAMMNIHREIDNLVEAMDGNASSYIHRMNMKRRGETGKMVIDALTKAKQAHLKDIDAKTADVYARHFTADEIKQMIAFYKTPVGQKVLKLRPLLIDEAMNANAENIKIFMREGLGTVVDKLRKKGMVVPRELEY